MPPNIGLGYAVGISEEATWGTLEASVDNWIPTEPNTENWERETEVIEDENLLDRGIRHSLVNAGHELVKGPMDFSMQFGGGVWPLLLAQLNGIDPTTAGAGPYTHTYELGKAIPTSNNLAKGINGFADREGMTGASTQKSMGFSGGKPLSMEFTFEQKKRARCKAEMMFKTMAALGNRLTPALSTRPFISLPSAATAPDPLFLYNGSQHICQKLSLKLEQAWDERRDGQEKLTRVPSIGGRMRITGSAEVEQPVTGTGTGGAFYDDFHAKTHRPIVITLNGPTSNHKVLCTIPKALVKNPQDPKVAGGGRIMQTVEFEAYFDSAVGYFASLVLTTDDATAWN